MLAPWDFPPLERSNERPWGTWIGLACLAAIPICLALILIFR